MSEPILDAQQAPRARSVAAAKYRPAKVSLLLVAEAPPCTTSRYFYFEDVPDHDHLFRYVCRGLLGKVSDRIKKRDDLAQMKQRGVFPPRRVRASDPGRREGANFARRH